MSKSIKLKNDNYIDSTGVTHNRNLLKNILDNIHSSIENINTTVNNLTNYSKYSNNEQVIGEWLNGKPLYRKCYPITVNQNINHGLKNVSIVAIRGFYTNNNNITFPIPTVRVAYPEYRVGCYVTSTQIVFDAGNGAVGSGYIILEYTKTTD